MPVDDNIHIKLDTYVNSLLEKLKASALVTHIALSVAPFVNIHSQTHDIGIPVITERPECALVHKFGEPCKSVCAHSPELIALAVLVSKLSVLHRKLTVLRNRSRTLGVARRGRNC